MKKAVFGLLLGLALGAVIFWSITEAQSIVMIILFVVVMVAVGYVVGRILRFFLQRGGTQAQQRGKIAKPAKARRRKKPAKKGKR